jgi:protein-tyrosine phosphatase
MYRIDSAGTGSWHVGEPPHSGSRAVAAQNGVDLSGQISRQVGPSELRDWDWVIAMDGSNHRNLARMGTRPGRLRMMLSFAGPETPADVPDPYYEGGFEGVFALVQQGCEGLFDFLESQ